MKFVCEMSDAEIFGDLPEIHGKIGDLTLPIQEREKLAQRFQDLIEELHRRQQSRLFDEKFRTS